MGGEEASPGLSLGKTALDTCTRIPEVQQAVLRHTILVTHASTKESTKAISSVLPKSMPKKTQKLGKERDYHLHIFG